MRVSRANGAEMGCARLNKGEEAIGLRQCGRDIEPQHRVRRINEITAWMDRYLK